MNPNDAPKQFVFLTSFSYPSQHAHPIWSLQMARGFAKARGISFTYVIAETRDRLLLKGISYLQTLPHITRSLQRLHLRTLAYALWLPIYFAARGWWGKDVIVFTNDPRLAQLALMYKPLLRYRVAFESHGDYTPALRKKIYGRADTIIFISNGLRTHAVQEDPTYGPKSVVEINAADVQQFFAVTESRDTLRTHLGLPREGIIIGYVGRFKPGGFEKGVSFMVRSLPALPSRYRMLLVGGTPEEIEETKALAASLGVSARVLLKPFVAMEEVPKYERACDLLAYVPEGTSFRHRETIPMKLLEYMASERPIVVSDLPAIRELVDGSCAFFCEAGSVASFVDAINHAERAPESFVQESYQRVKKHTWSSRAQCIVDACIAGKE